MEPFLDLAYEQVFAQIPRTTISFLFRTAIVSIPTTHFSRTPLSGKHTATLAATKKIGKGEIVLAAYLALMLSARKDFLNGFKLGKQSAISKVN